MEPAETRADKSASGHALHDVGPPKLLQHVPGCVEEMSERVVVVMRRMQQIKSDWKEIPHIKPSLSKVRHRVSPCSNVIFLTVRAYSLTPTQV